ncbi:MAG: hypothetical protein RMY16_23335, partial [Nostoc sp. DedQUE12b]|uniref:hypothetical protein n=1 Tax=Nostoc sp. DedQUE12b TaxID=3075398 RepID=UPI002AD293E2
LDQQLRQLDQQLRQLDQQLREPFQQVRELDQSSSSQLQLLQLAEIVLLAPCPQTHNFVLHAKQNCCML